MTTPQDNKLSAFLEEMKKVGENATPGPWRNDCGNGEVETEAYRVKICNRAGNYDRKVATERIWCSGVPEEAANLLKYDNEEDMNFIATARNNWEKLIKLNEILLEACESAIKASYRGSGTNTECDMSYQLQDAIEACLKEVSK